MKLIFPIVFLLGVMQLFAGNISGRVTDENGKLLPFATIVVKGTHTGVTANSEGYYVLTLAPGNYTIECRYVGYATIEKNIIAGDGNTELNFSLKIQNLQLEEIVIDPRAEDPAYEIIRNTIRQRPYYNGQVSSFSADVYVKGMIRLLNLPDKVLGKKIEAEDRKDIGLDSSGQGIIYLSESLTKVHEQKPDKVKMEVVSSRVSGSDGFGLDFPVFISFYENIVDVSRGTFSKRGFVSPIADNALNFYEYKFLGSFFENGKQVHSIRVIPRRKFEPLFSGTINITEGDWRIYSCQLLLTPESQLQILDSLEITQIHSHQYRDIWRVKSQIIHFHVRQFGIEIGGNFVDVYTNYNLRPDFPKGFFDRTIIQYDKYANKRTDAYWDTTRPVSLEPAEIKDFREKDSIKIVRDSAVLRSLDSIRGRLQKVSLKDIAEADANWYFYPKSGDRSTLTLEGLIKGLQYNTVEGISINPSLVFATYWRPLKSQIKLISDLRYGFGNKHLNLWGGIVLDNAKMNPGFIENFDSHKFCLAGGKRVSQFFKLSPLDNIVSTFSTLLWGWNEMKLYENYFLKAGYSRSWLSGVRLSVEGLYEDRTPLENTTDYLLNKKWQTRLTPNYPTEVLSAQFSPHKAVVLHTSFSFQPGQRYIQYPDYKYSLGSKMPAFTFQYFKGIPDLLGSDEDFDRWELDVRHDLKLNLGGRLSYRVGGGGFLNSNNVFIQDFKHFPGTNSHLSEEYVKSFQSTTIYQYSNASSFYSELHAEHHADGMITNKVPLLRKWNWNLVDGFNALLVAPDKRHLELFAGLENILKIFRVDIVYTMQDGFKPFFNYRIGFGGLMGDMMNNRFRRQEKIIDRW